MKEKNPKQRGTESICSEDNTSTVSFSPLAVVTVGTGFSACLPLLGHEITY